MIAMVSAVFGFISSAVPDVIKFLREGKDRAHEITLLKLQMEYDRERVQQGTAEARESRAFQLEVIGLQAEMLEQQLLNTRVKESLTGIHWVDALAGSVRPVITYAFFGLYFLVKCAQFYALFALPFPWQQPMTASAAMLALWTEEDIAIFSAVIAFWFGQRAMGKMRRQV